MVTSARGKVLVWTRMLDTDHGNEIVDDLDHVEATVNYEKDTITCQCSKTFGLSPVNGEDGEWTGQYLAGDFWRHVLAFHIIPSEMCLA